MSDWQPISTAPKDDSRILGFNEKNRWVQITRFFEPWQSWTYHDMSEWEPTHWMPLPQPPSRDEVIGGGTTAGCATKAEKHSSSS